MLGFRDLQERIGNRTWVNKPGISATRYATLQGANPGCLTDPGLLAGLGKAGGWLSECAPCMQCPPLTPQLSPTCGSGWASTPPAAARRPPPRSRASGPAPRPSGAPAAIMDEACGSTACDWGTHGQQLAAARATCCAAHTAPSTQPGGCHLSWQACPPASGPWRKILQETPAGAGAGRC